MGGFFASGASRWHGIRSPAVEVPHAAGTGQWGDRSQGKRLMGHCDFVINGRTSWWSPASEERFIRIAAHPVAAAASLACMFVSVPGTQSPDCGMKLCEEHALAVEVACCPPHFKLVTRALNR